MLHYFTSTTFEKSYDFVNIRSILLLRYSPDAATGTFLYMIVQTWSEFSMKDRIRGYLQIASAQRINTMKELHKITCMNHTAVWSEIAGSITDHASGKEHLWKHIIADTDPWVGLGILQQYIVSWLELLYQIVFQK
jgi:hypothetical protein